MLLNNLVSFLIHFLLSLGYLALINQTNHKALMDSRVLAAFLAFMFYFIAGMLLKKQKNMFRDFLSVFSTGAIGMLLWLYTFISTFKDRSVDAWILYGFYNISIAANFDSINYYNPLAAGIPVIYSFLFLLGLTVRDKWIKNKSLL